MFEIFINNSWIIQGPCIYDLYYGAGFVVFREDGTLIIR